MLERRHSAASIPSHHDIYPRGEAPWELEQASMEKILGDAAEPSTEYHASWDALPRPRIGNLTTYELMMFYDGDKRPLTMRLEQIPQGPQRDAVEPISKIISHQYKHTRKVDETKKVVGVVFITHN